MSAECHKCGSDIVYPEGTWPVGQCEVCDLRAQVETLTKERDALLGAHEASIRTVLLNAQTLKVLAACEAQVETLRDALIRCAEVAGADGEAIAAARSDAMKHPSVEEFAVEAVMQLRRDYDNALEGDKP